MPTGTDFVDQQAFPDLKVAPAAELNVRPEGSLSQITTFDQSGWPMSEIPNGEKLISALTSDDLQKAAIKYLRTDNYVRVSLYPENFSGAVNR